VDEILNTHTATNRVAA